MDKSVEKYRMRRDERIKERQKRFDWDENDHPRDENGRFSSGGGGKSSKGSKSGGALSKDKRSKVEGIIKKIKKQKPEGGFTSGGLSDELMDNIGKLMDYKKSMSSEEQKEVDDILKKHGLL